MADASAIPIVETAPEEWRPIPGYVGRYEVSSHGRVRALRRNTRWGDRALPVPEILRSHLDRHTRYMLIRLASGGRKTFHGAVHTLVALAFLGLKPTPKHQVAHLDGNRDNNVLSNLVYATQAENEAHKKVHGRDNRAGGQRALAISEVREMRQLRARFGEKIPMWVLGQMFGISKWTAGDICSGKAYGDVS